MTLIGSDGGMLPAVTWRKPHIRMELGRWVVTDHRYLLAPMFLSADFCEAVECAQWLYRSKQQQKQQATIQREASWPRRTS